MPSHAQGHRKTGFGDMVAAWLSMWRKTGGRHEPREGATPAAALIGEPARFNWPGAEPDWADKVRAMQDTVVMRAEVRA